GGRIRETGPASLSIPVRRSARIIGVDPVSRDGEFMASKRETTDEPSGFASTLASNKDRLRNTLISDRVYELLRQAIVDGELGPNERVVESEIARRLGVSQAPVREAVKQLAREGLLMHVPRRGNFVVEISSKDAEHARQVREPLERLAAGLAAGQLTE